MKNEHTLTAPENPLAIIAAAKDADPANLEKLMELQERWENRQAQRSFSEALAAFQSECPIIQKTRKGHNSLYASYDDIIREIRPLLQKHGLSVRFSTSQAESSLHVTCIVSHAAGHCEESTLTIPVDASMRANDSQKVGSANSYARRYAIMNALNIVVSEEDDDGTAGCTVEVTEKQADEIFELIQETGTDLDKFLDWAGCGSVNELPATKYKAAKQLLQAKR